MQVWPPPALVPVAAVSRVGGQEGQEGPGGGGGGVGGEKALHWLTRMND